MRNYTPTNLPKVNEQIEQLRDAIGALDFPHKDRGFAESLVAQYDRTGSLSNKQWYWVGQLTERASAGMNRGPEKTEWQELAGFNRVLELIRHAVDRGIEWPVIRCGEFRIMGSRKFDGARIVMEKRESYSDKRPFVGKINADGVLTWPVKKPIPDQIMKALQELEANPAESMKVYGRRTGNCCMCGRTLTNHASIDAGIGPICAESFGV